VEICSWKRALAPCLIDGFSAAKEAAFSWGGWGFHSTLVNGSQLYAGLFFFVTTLLIANLIIDSTRVFIIFV
jgi:hypothetical protein